jgi:hypothetical protein
MEPIAVVLVFHAWDMDVCTLLLRNGESLSGACVNAADVPKTRDVRG